MKEVKSFLEDLINISDVKVYQNKYYLAMSALRAEPIEIEYEQAKKHFEKNQIKQAKKILLDKLTSFNVKHKDHYHELLGVIAFFENDFQEAYSRFDKAIDQNSDNDDYQISKAACLIFLNKFAPAKKILLEMQGKLSFPSIYLNLGKIFQRKDPKRYKYYADKQKEFASLNENYRKYKGLESSFTKEVRTDEMKRQDQAFQAYFRQEHNFQDNQQFFKFIEKLEEYSLRRKECQLNYGILYKVSIGKILLFSQSIIQQYYHLKDTMTQMVNPRNKKQFGKILQMMKTLVKDAQNLQAIECQQFNTDLKAIKEQIKKIEEDLINKYSKGRKNVNPGPAQPSNQHQQSIKKFIDGLSLMQNNRTKILQENNQKQPIVINRKPDFDSFLSQIQVSWQASFFQESIIAVSESSSYFLYLSDNFTKDYSPKIFIDAISQQNVPTKKFYLNFYWLIFFHLFLYECKKLDMNSENQKELKIFISYLYREQFVPRKDCQAESPLKFSEDSIQKGMKFLDSILLTEDNKVQIQTNTQNLKSRLEQLSSAFTSLFNSMQKREFLKSEQPQKEIKMFVKNFRLNSQTIQNQATQAYLIFLYHLKEKQNKKFEIVSNILNSMTEDDRSSYNGQLNSIIRDAQKLQWVRQNITGFDTRYLSQLKLEVESLYIDHTATNRPFKPIQTMIDHSKLLIANPHTEFSRYGKFSTQLMHKSLHTLLECFNTSQQEFVALPTGSGSTGAIEKALNVIQNIQWAKNATIFITPYEHHSNILPWIELYKSVNVLEHDSDKNIDTKKVEQQIRKCPNQSIIVSVSAASNVTSQTTDLHALNRIIKKLKKQKKSGHKNIIFAADCAAFCCHHHLDLQKYDELDFAYLSPHKNLGGCESCGILLARKSILSRSKPTFPGGGTVKFVKGYQKQDILYEAEPFSREIAGTPPFLGFYRAALSFELLTKQIGYDFIHLHEVKNTELFFRLINKSNETLKKDGQDVFINIYGDKNLQNRANVVTFNFQSRNQFIQHSFASLLFTDVFGIQIRSGCFCAGPFGIQLLHINQKKAEQIKEEVEVDIMINKPGYLRLDLTFYLEDYEVEYIAAASLLIAQYWQNFKKFYTICNDGQILLNRAFKSPKIQQIF